MMHEGAPPGAPIMDHDPDAQQLEEFLSTTSTSSSYTITTASNVKHTHTWRVHNFSLLPYSKQDPVESLKFTVGRAEFIMRLFANGRAHESNDRVSVFIKLVNIHPEANSTAARSRLHSSNSSSSSLDHAASAVPSSPVPHSLSHHSNSISPPGHPSLSALKLNCKYRFRYVYPSGDREKDEVIPIVSKPWYHYKFALNDEHEGAYVTKPALEERGFLKNDCLIIQVELEIIMQPTTFLSFSHSIPFVDVRRGHQLLGRDFQQSFVAQKSCDVFFRIVGPNANSAAASASSSDFVDLIAPAHSHSSSSSAALTGLDSSEDLISAHKFVLCARSPVFAAMFAHQMRENKDKVIEISDMDRPTLLRMLSHFYTGELPQVHNRHQSSESHEPSPVQFEDAASPSPPSLSAAAAAAAANLPSAISWSARDVSSVMPSFECPPITGWFDAIKLYKAAAKYNVQYLCELTAFVLVDFITTSNVLLTLQFAEFFSHTPGALFIKTAAKNYLLRHFDQVLKSSVAPSDPEQVAFFESFMTIASPATAAAISTAANKPLAIEAPRGDPRIESLAVGSPIYIVGATSREKIAEGILLHVSGSAEGRPFPTDHALVLVGRAYVTRYERQQLPLPPWPCILDPTIDRLTQGATMFIPYNCIVGAPGSFHIKEERGSASKSQHSAAADDEHTGDEVAESEYEDRKHRALATPASAPNPLKRSNRGSLSPNSASPVTISNPLGPPSKRKRTANK